MDEVCVFILKQVKMQLFFGILVCVCVKSCVAAIGACVFRAQLLLRTFLFPIYFIKYKGEKT